MFMGLLSNQKVYWFSILPMLQIQNFTFSVWFFTVSIDQNEQIMCCSVLCCKAVVCNCPIISAHLLSLSCVRSISPPFFLCKVISGQLHKSCLFTLFFFPPLDFQPSPLFLLWEQHLLSHSRLQGSWAFVFSHNKSWIAYLLLPFAILRYKGQKQVHIGWPLKRTFSATAG